MLLSNSVRLLGDQKMSKTSLELRRKMVAREMGHVRIPNSNISLIIRIKGKVTREMVKLALNKAQIRHNLLRVHLEFDEEQEPWFVGNGIIDFPIKVMKRESDDQWAKEILIEHKIPFEFEKGPLIRFFLLQGSETSDLIIFCQHIICDGMSLTYLARDILTYMGDPNIKVESPPEPPLPVKENIPEGIKPSAMIKIFGGKIAKMWAKDEILFDEEDFLNIHKVFWDRYEYKVHLLSFTDKDTTKLAERCRENGVTVNSTLAAAFALAQEKVHGEIRPYMKKLASAVNLRDKLINPVGELLSFCASGIETKPKFKKGISIWELSKVLKDAMKKQFKARKELSGVLSAEIMPSSFIRSSFFAAYAKYVTPEQSRYKKMSEFAANKKNILIKSIGKRLKKGTVLGQIMTNLGRLNFPTVYGDLELEEIIFMPSGSPFTEIVLGIVTMNGKLNITANHMESTINSEKMRQIIVYVNKLINEILTS